MSAPLSLESRLDQVRQQIASACARYDRNPASVNLLAVSKTKPASAIREAIASGQRHFGENYLQEAQGKIGEIHSTDVVWHFIGAIQSNKTRLIAEHFDWVHTLASAKHARRLHDARPADTAPLKVLIQVNIADEDSKAGVAPEKAAALAASIAGFDRLELRGLMAIPRIEESFEAQRAQFRRLADLRTEVAQGTGIDLQDLSMGMTGDMDAAIAEGSTWLRIGTAIFGPRQSQQSRSET